MYDLIVLRVPLAKKVNWRDRCYGGATSLLWDEVPLAIRNGGYPHVFNSIVNSVMAAALC